MKTITIGNETFAVPEEVDDETLQELQQGEGEIISNPISEPTALENAVNNTQEAGNTVLNVFADIANGLSKPIYETIDMLGTDTVNAILGLSGVDYQLPQLTQKLEELGVYRGQPHNPGMLGEIPARSAEVASMALGGQGVLRSGLSNFRKVSDEINDLYLDATGKLKRSDEIPSLSTEWAEKTIDKLPTNSHTIDLLKRLPTNLKANTAAVINVVAKEKPLTAAGVGAISGAAGVPGQEYGGETGQFIAEMAAPNLVNPVSRIVRNGYNTLTNLEPPANQAQEAADKIIMDQLNDLAIRSGKTPAQLQNEVIAMGEGGTLADISDDMKRALRTAGNFEPYVQNLYQNKFDQRGTGAYSRVREATLAKAQDENTNAISQNVSRGYSSEVDDALHNLMTNNQQIIDKLYNDAERTPMEITGWMKRAFEGDPESLSEGINTIAKLQPKVSEQLANEELIGGQASLFRRIDETKKIIDDEIEKNLNQSGGKPNNSTRRLVVLKNQLLDEADSQNPAYKKARDYFSGIASLQNAAQIGKQFFKRDRRDILEETRKMGEQELEFFWMGARDAIFRKLDETVRSNNPVRKLFKKHGETNPDVPISKLRPLFRNDADFNKFMKAIETEYQFAKTAQAVRGNSNTTLQLEDMKNAKIAIGDSLKSLYDIGTGNYLGVLPLLKKLKTGKSNITQEEFEKTPEYDDMWYRLGTIMLMRGDELTPVIKLMESRSSEKFDTALKKAIADSNKIDLRTKAIYKPLMPYIYYLSVPANQSEQPQKINQNNL